MLVVISAPSGGGKTTLCQQLLATRKDMTRAITCTTRPARAGEKDAVDYFFLDASTFLRRVQAGHFLEHATVYGNSYGTLRSWASLLEEEDIADLLADTLDEEKGCDEQLTEIAESTANIEAAEGEGAEMEEEGEESEDQTRRTT